MDNFDLRKYLAENKLLKEELTWFVEDEMADVRYENDAYLKEVEDKIKKLHPDISDEDLNEIIFRTGEQYSREEDFHGDSIPSSDFANAAVEIYQTDILALRENRLLKEFIGGELETRNEPLFDKLVPVQGKAETLEGEMLRAINRMVYRYYNDGDKYYEGYGAETAGPAVSFLVNAIHPLRAEMSRIMNGNILSDNEYENMLKEALGLILDYIEGKEGEYTKNTEGDMFDYESEYEDDDDYYDDYEDDDDYYQE